MLNEILPLSIISTRRPGVATRRSAPPRSSSRSCCPMGLPPYTTIVRSMVRLENFLASSAICMANSRVGASTSAEGYALPYGCLGGGFLSSWFMMGRRKAAVFPEPVCAQLIRSRLLPTIGIEYFCTGVGFLYPASLMFLISLSSKRDSGQAVMCAGQSLPEVSTGISSY